MQAVLLGKNDCIFTNQKKEDYLWLSDVKVPAAKVAVVGRSNATSTPCRAAASGSNFFSGRICAPFYFHNCL